MTGCGRISFDELVTTPDADTSCWPAWRSGVAFEPSVLRGDINSAAHEKNPFLSADRLSLYFATDRAGGQGDLDFWYAQRADPEGDFAIAGPIATLSGTSAEGRLELDDTGLVAVFSAIRPGGAGGYDLYLATRADTSSPFVIDPTITAALSSPLNEKDPHFLGGSPARLYYSVGETEFRVAERNGDGAYGPSLLVEVSLPIGTIVADPQPSPDELTLVYGSGTVTDLDFFVATRSSTSEPFADPQLLAAISAPTLDRDISVTADGCEVWYSKAVPDDEIVMTRVVR